MITEKPVGICPSCGQTVFNSKENDGPVWICPADLYPDNPFFQQHFIVSEDKKEESGKYSNCLNDHFEFLRCELSHLPLHSACYEGQDY